MATRGARSKDKVDQIYKLNQMIPLLAQSETFTRYAFSALPLKNTKRIVFPCNDYPIGLDSKSFPVQRKGVKSDVI